MNKPEFETIIINTPELFSRLTNYVEALNPEMTVLDVETDSEKEKLAKLYGIGMCFTDKKAFYIVWRNKEGELIWNPSQIENITNWIKAICKNTKVIGHNIIYDVLVIENNLNIDITDCIYSDTILQKHTLEEEPPFGLKEISVQILGEWADKAQQTLKDNIIKNGGIFKKAEKHMYKADTEVLAEYCAFDVILTYLLFNIFEERLEKENLIKLFYEEEVMPLYKKVTIPMKKKGFPINLEHFHLLKSEIEIDINKLEDEIIKSIKKDISTFESNILNKNYPISNRGNFPKVLAELISAPLPISKKTGKITISKTDLKKQIEEYPQFEQFYNWIMGLDTNFINSTLSRKVQEKLYFQDNKELRYIFNLKSNDHLAELIVNIWGIETLEKTETGKPKIDDEFLETLKQNPIIRNLIDYKKLNKISSTYIDGILERHIDGIIYTSMLQFGTTSGRYSSRSPNLQNLVRVKDEDSNLSELVLKYANSIRKGFIAPKGYKIVDADYNQLEPKCYGEMSNEPKLKEVFIKGEDLYSRVAIDVNKLENKYSANKKEPNYLGNLNKELRQLWKIPTLGIVYGMEESRLIEAIGCSRTEASKIINGYLNTYPNLKKYMNQCEFSAKTTGQIKTSFGRIRHLDNIKTLYRLHGDDLLDYRWANSRGLKKERRNFKTGLNNAKNFRIQGLAAHIINRSMIALAKELKNRNLEAYIALMIHDQVVCIVKEEHSELVKNIMQDKMENTIKLSIPLTAEPKIAINLAESH